MDLSARDATILTLLSAHPSTRFFARLVAKLESAEAKRLAERIGASAKTEDAIVALGRGDGMKG